MRPKIREILEECIELGIEHGIKVAHKYVDDPPHDLLAGSIDNCIWFEIDQRFDFDRNVCDEVVEGFDQLEKEREWVGLTEYDIQTIAGNTREDDFFAIKKTWKNRFAEAIEDTLKRRNT